jgi:DNA-nicking Smr family endonuclease
VTQKLPPEDLHLWKINTRDVKPLTKQTEKTQEVPPKSKKTHLPSTAPLPKPTKSIASPTPLPSLDRRQLKRVKIEARFDMHGLSLEKGYNALERFLRTSQQRGFKTVLVITGKGSLTAENTLRRQLPFWVEETPMRQLVATLHHPAKIHDGGHGAYYLELRKMNKVNPYRPKKKEI